ncbi:MULTISPECIES: hypothetical protein [unclassified Nocardiopsis]|uniref:hypothetical protein n=1 Tax=unclassified Nocardiopsis TaxID=2649073 RepID=UPI0013577793|nr:MULTISPECIES: hypothetical protein [unclassified Nocardiopsis]
MTPPPPSEPDGPPRPSRERWLLAGVVLAAFVALLALRVQHWGRLDQTALFYVGLPATIALFVVLTVRARTVVGVALAATTVCLTLAGPLLGEGLVCLLIAAPLIYGVVALVGWVAGLILRGGRSQHALFAVPLLFALALEGVAGVSLLPRADRGEGSVLVAADPASVAAALAAPPAYGEPEALFLRAVPFPRPVEASGEGLEAGDTRSVRFTPRRVLRPGAEPTPRHMELRVAESRVGADGGRVVFDVVEDTAFANWMDMRRAEAVWRAEGGGTRLTWTIDYERTYEPSWYFGPVQSYATDLAAGYLGAAFAAAASGEGS